MNTQPMSSRAHSSPSEAGYACSMTSIATPERDATHSNSRRHAADSDGAEPYIRAHAIIVAGQYTST